MSLARGLFILNKFLDIYFHRWEHFFRWHLTSVTNIFQCQMVLFFSRGCARAFCWFKSTVKWLQQIGKLLTYYNENLGLNITDLLTTASAFSCVFLRTLTTQLLNFVQLLMHNKHSITELFAWSIILALFAYSALFICFITYKTNHLHYDMGHSCVDSVTL